MRLDRFWIVRDRNQLTESVEELTFAAVLRGRADDAVNLPHVVLGCAPGTWDIEHWEAFSTIDEAQGEARRRGDGFGR